MSLMSSLLRREQVLVAGTLQDTQGTLGLVGASVSGISRVGEIKLREDTQTEQSAGLV